MLTSIKSKDTGSCNICFDRWTALLIIREGRLNTFSASPHFFPFFSTYPIKRKGDQTKQQSILSTTYPSFHCNNFLVGDGIIPIGVLNQSISQHLFKHHWRHPVLTFFVNSLSNHPLFRKMSLGLIQKLDYNTNSTAYSIDLFHTPHVRFLHIQIHALPNIIKGFNHRHIASLHCIKDQ